MYIQKIEWIDKESKEAVLKVGHNKESLMCFSCPCIYNIGDLLIEPLECLDTEDIILCDEKEGSIERINETFRYIMKGKLMDMEKGIVDVCGFNIHIEEDRIPSDIKNGMYIQFFTSRIDIW